MSANLQSKTEHASLANFKVHVVLHIFFEIIDLFIFLIDLDIELLLISDYRFYLFIQLYYLVLYSGNPFLSSLCLLSEVIFSIYKLIFSLPCRYLYLFNLFSMNQLNFIHVLLMHLFMLFELLFQNHDLRG